MTAAFGGSPPGDLPSIRAVNPFDLEFLAVLHAACFPEEPWDAAALGQMLSLPGCFGLLAVGGQPLGLVLCRVAADEAEVLTLGVAPTVRQAGVGRALVEAAAARARALGAARLFLEVAADNAAGLCLYRGCGFVTVGRRPAYYRRGGHKGFIDALILKREFDA